MSLVFKSFFFSKHTNAISVSWNNAECGIWCMPFWMEMFTKSKHLEFWLRGRRALCFWCNILANDSGKEKVLKFEKKNEIFMVKFQVFGNCLVSFFCCQFPPRFIISASDKNSIKKLRSNSILSIIFFFNRSDGEYWKIKNGRKKHAERSIRF